MAILSKTHININGNDLHHYNNCKLVQEISDHHTLTINCFLETIQVFCNKNKLELEELLGTIITIETKSYENIDFHGILKFKGIITGLNYRKGMHAGNGDYVIINAKSPTIISDDGPNHTSYNDMSFVDVIKKNYVNYDTSKLSINTNNCKLNKPLIYTVQYNESSFKFAKRMAARFGQWMFYNGEELIFGLEDNSNEIELILGRDLQEFNTSLTPIAQNYEYFTNDYLTNDIHEILSSSSNGASEGTYGALNDSSNDIYANTTSIWVNLSDDSNAKNRLDETANLQRSALESRQMLVSGNSDNPGVGLGTVIKIAQNNYRVTKVTHTYSNNGEYENFFEAISINIVVSPLTNINAFPFAYNQTAKVTENNDPDGLGRIKVQFAWQKKDGLSTPWIRNVSPSASSSQGFFFVPEIDDEVVVNFEGGNAECPYALGGVYNAKSTPSEEVKDPDNCIKSIKAGACKIELNSCNGTITIQDKAGSSIFLDGKGNINISAEKEISLSGGKEVSISSGDEVSIEAGKEVSISSGDEVSILGGKEVSIASADEVSIQATKEVSITGMETNINGSKVIINGIMTTEIKGALLKLN